MLKEEREFEAPGELQAAEPLGPEPGAAESAVVELLATWGAAADLATADLLQAISQAPTVSGRLLEIHQKARDLLPADLRAELARCVATLRARGARQAATTDADPEGMLARAMEALKAEISRRREALIAELGPALVLLEAGEFGRALEPLWRSERCATAEEFLLADGDLQQVRRLLEGARQALLSEIESAAAAGAGEDDASDLARIRGNARSADPIRLLESSRAVRQIRGRQTRSAGAGPAVRSRERLAAAWDRLRREDGGAAEGPGPRARELRARALAEAERILKREAGDPDSGEAWQAVLGAWETALGALLEKEIGPSGDAPAIRQALLDALREREARLSDRARLEGPLRQLRASAARLGSLLEQAGDRLPAPRVVQARRLVERAAGVLAFPGAEPIDQVEETIRRELEALQRLAEQEQQRRRDRERSARQALQAEAERLADAAPARIRRRFESLLAELQGGARVPLDALRSDLERLGLRVEQAVRLRCGRDLRAATRWLEKASPGAAGRGPGPAHDLKRGVADLAAAQEGDDLALMRERAAEVRSALMAVAPLARPLLRGFMVAACALLALGGLYFWKMRGEWPRTCRLELTAPPSGAVHVSLVRDGRIVEERPYSAEDGGVSFELAPGRYEVYVNRRFTGRVFNVPGETEIEGIPVPADSP